MMEFPAATCPPTKADQIAMGVDCVRHPIVTGAIISNNGTPPLEQARNFLRSLRQAIDNVTGRQGDLSDAEFREWMLKLEAWHKTNEVKMPTPIMPADHRLHRR
jgi:hypothetical protein